MHKFMYMIKVPIIEIRYVGQEQQIIVYPWHEVNTNRNMIEQLLQIDAHEFHI